MNETLQDLQVGNNVRVKIENIYEYGTVTGIENRTILIQLASDTFLTKEVTFEDFVELSYEIVSR